MKKIEMLPDDADDYFLWLKEENNQYADVTNLASESGKKGKYYLFSKAYYFHGDNDYYFHGSFYGGFTYVDLLYPGVTEKFIQVTMDEYEKFAGDEFGKAMPGIFTDEPHLNSPGGIRWTPDLFDVFKKQWGYDLKLNLPSLYEEVGEWKKVRHNYAQILLQLFINRWAKPYYHYCESKNLQLTGHYWEHTWPFIRLGPDNMAMYQWLQIPGIDMLFNQFNETSTNAQFGNVRSVKELASVANQLGRHRSLCETYGGAGWDLTFQDMKRLGDWEYALGVNMMNQHMSPMTIVGTRKYDHPPYFSYHEPWWKDYKYLNKYFARLSVLLSSGKQVNDILVIEPTTTTWMYDSYFKPDEMTSIIGNSFQAFVTELEKMQVEYDLGSENIIKELGKVEKDKLIVGRCSYSRVVLPPFTENLDSTTFYLLKQFVRHGGKLFIFSIPKMIDGSSDHEISDFFMLSDENIKVLEELTPEVESEYFRNKNFEFKNIDGGNLYHNRRRMEDGQILFLVNSSLDDSTTGELVITGKDAVEMNAFTGEIADFSEKQIGEKIKLSFSIPPAGSLLLFVSGSKINDIILSEQPDTLVPVPSVYPMSIRRQEDNVLVIDFCDLSIGEQSFKDLHVLDAAEKVFQLHGFEKGNPWNSYVQYQNNLMSRDTFGLNTGFATVYRFNIEEEFDFSGMKAVVERPDLWTILINGNEIKNEPGQWWLDRSFGVFSIGKWIKTGENKLTVMTSRMKIKAEIEPVYILGDFSVVPTSKGWNIKSPHGEYVTGSWKNQGMPFYSWGVSYTKTFDVQRLAQYYEIVMGKWNGTVSEVTVNGTSTGIIAFPPNKLDVTEFIKEGHNQIEIRVIGSLKNLLGPHHNNPPQGLAISPFWHGVKSYSAGKDYQIIDYGLMDNFYLYQGN